jgi:hypothetical protein
MYNEKIEMLISAALADGVLTEKEKQILFKRAQEQGIDLDEFEMVLDARLVELQKAEKEKTKKSAPKSTKFGDVRKCPACGALVHAMAVSCAECGFEFTGLEASSSAQTLSKEISKIKRSGKWDDGYEEIEELIKNFPVPNAKHDLFDLIVFLKQHIEDEAYEQKLQECLDRAKYLFPSDPLFAKVIADATKAKDIKKAKESGDHIMLAVLGICTFGSIGVYYWWAESHNWGWAGWTFGWILFLAIGEIGGFGLGALIKLIYVKGKESK